MTISVNEVIKDIRAITGVTSETISDEDLTRIVQRNINKYGDDDKYLCEVTYYSILDMLKHLTVISAVDQASSGGSGSVSSRKEREGNVEIEVRYETSKNNTSSNSWEDIYQMFLDDPSLVCDSLEPKKVIKDGIPVINSGKNRYGVKTPYRKTYYNQRYPFKR
tara:strand:- start:45 stop:536 length:492 start_codon:yes stop_codon:yes gene_type:complete